VDNCERDIILNRPRSRYCHSARVQFEDSYAFDGYDLYRYCHRRGRFSDVHRDNHGHHDTDSATDTCTDLYTFGKSDEYPGWWQLHAYLEREQYNFSRYRQRHRDSYDFVWLYDRVTDCRADLHLYRHVPPEQRTDTYLFGDRDRDRWWRRGWRLFQ
jgi:hypothetical protein